MSNETTIGNFLHEAGLVLSGPVVPHGIDNGRYFAFVEVKRNDNNLQTPSNTKLRGLQDVLSQQGAAVEFILIDGTQKDIEAGVRATLLYQFGDRVRNSFISIDGRTAHLWLVPKRTLADEDIAEISQKVSIYLDTVGLTLSGAYSTSNGKLPSKSACLSIIRTVAPANLDQIISKIRDKGFIVPSRDWMSRMLDNLRKSGFVLRQKSGTYVLSLAGLKAAGTSKNARSADITRLLDLARRRV